MGLRYPQSLDAWKSWQIGSSPYRLLRAAVRRSIVEPPLQLVVRGEHPQILIALDATTPTSVASYLRPLAFLGGVPVAIVSAGNVFPFLPGKAWRSVALDSVSRTPRELQGVRAVLAAGNYLRAGAQAFDWARGLDAKFVIAQHGLTTPFAPPLPPSAHLLSFSDADATFWGSGRIDITHEAVGSQLLWAAGESSRVEVAHNARPVFLGQLHGAELPRRGLVQAATSFCRATGATYRPHPSEVDKLSRLQHGLWQRQGIIVDRSTVLSGQLAAPVVSVFSTGVLEAAARGIPSWVTYKSPPSWLTEFWARYSLSPWGSEPTPAPVQPRREPAESIARALQGFMKGAA